MAETSYILAKWGDILANWSHIPANKGLLLNTGSNRGHSLANRVCILASKGWIHACRDHVLASKGCTLADRAVFYQI